MLDVSIIFCEVCWYLCICSTKDVMVLWFPILAPPRDYSSSGICMFYLSPCEPLTSFSSFCFDYSHYHFDSAGGGTCPCSGDRTKLWWSWWSHNVVSRLSNVPEGLLGFFLDSAKHCWLSHSLCASSNKLSFKYSRRWRPVIWFWFPLR